MTGAQRTWVQAPVLLLAALGPWLTVGEGALLILAAVLVLRTSHPAAQLALAAACALGLGEAARAPDVFSAVAVLGLGAHLLRRRRAPPLDPRWSPSLPVLLVTGALGLGLMALPHVLPLPEVVQPRPWSESLPGMAALVVTVLGLAALVRVPPAGPVVLAAALAGVVPLVTAGWTLATVASGTQTAQVEGTRTARRLGLAEWSADLVERALRDAEARGDLSQLRPLFEQDTREDDFTRRRPEVLRTGARGLEVTGGPASDVDWLVQRALRAASKAELAPFLEVWPGRARTVAAARRARVHLAEFPELAQEPPGSRDGVKDCFGGTWCLLAAEMPEFRGTLAQGPLRLHWRLVAPPVSDVMAVLEIDWRHWRAAALLSGAGVPVGDEVVQDVLVDSTDAVSGDNQVWLHLVPVDQGHALRLEGLPGVELMVGHALVP